MLLNKENFYLSKNINFKARNLELFLFIYFQMFLLIFKT